MTPPEHHTIESLVSALEYLQAAAPEPVSWQDLAELTGFSEDNVRWLVYDLRFGHGEIVQSDKAGGYFLATEEFEAVNGTCVWTPQGVGLVKFARPGFPSLTVHMSRDRIERFPRSECSTTGYQARRLVA